MNRPSSELQQAIEFAFDELKKHDRDFGRLPFELQTLVRVVSAKGVIGNGGMRYFFERDWEGTPDYREFAGAFRTIGANEVADAIEGTVALFGFDDPHLDGPRRLEKYHELWEMDPSPLASFEFSAIDLWHTMEKTDTLLENYVTNHRAVFLNN